VFDGQQSDEKILAEIRPHIYSEIFAFVKVILILLIFYLVLLSISTLIPVVSGVIRLLSTVFLLISLVGFVSWMIMAYNRSVTYITDRRIMRFEQLSPIYKAKRALFWKEALKAKAYQTNIIWRMLKIGTVQVEPQAADQESVRITDIYLFEDLANYIDKIIYIIKNKPQDISTLRSFIPKFKGMRD